MIPYPEFDPVAIALGPVKVRWYGLTYVVGFACAWLILRARAAKPASGWSAEQAEDVIVFAALGIILGGRLGYVFFYAFDRLLADPLYLLRIWEGGMSFHGGLIGVLIAMALFARKKNSTFFAVTDFIAPAVPLGLGAGRVGNFINGELWGKPTDVPWAFLVDGVGVHPSQLYEALLEGLVLFLLLWLFTARPRPRMAASGLFLLGYGTFRFGVEFVRVPDEHLGYLAFDWFTMGQLLTLPMIIGGIVLLFLAYGRKEKTARAV